MYCFCSKRDPRNVGVLTGWRARVHVNALGNDPRRTRLREVSNAGRFKQFLPPDNQSPPSVTGAAPTVQHPRARRHIKPHPLTAHSRTHVRTLGLSTPPMSWLPTPWCGLGFSGPATEVRAVGDLAAVADAMQDDEFEVATGEP
jgi:hypothetical protein